MRNPLSTLWHMLLYLLALSVFSIPLACGAYVFLANHQYFYGHPIYMYSLVLACGVYICLIKTFARKSVKRVFGDEEYMRVMRLMEDR